MQIPLVTWSASACFFGSRRGGGPRRDHVSRRHEEAASLIAQRMERRQRARRLLRNVIKLSLAVAAVVLASMFLFPVNADASSACASAQARRAA
jgi:hypothetical protein